MTITDIDFSQPEKKNSSRAIIQLMFQMLHTKVTTTSVQKNWVTPKFWALKMNDVIHGFPKFYNFLVNFSIT